jgi:hypothetical protein
VPKMRDLGGGLLVQKSTAFGASVGAGRGGSSRARMGCGAAFPARLRCATLAKSVPNRLAKLAVLLVLFRLGLAMDDCSSTDQGDNAAKQRSYPHGSAAW